MSFVDPEFQDEKGRFRPGNPGGPGRSTLYTPEIADEICNRLAAGESLNRICRDAHLPAKATVIAWSMDTKHPFADQYARARQIQYLGMGDEITDIADDGSNDYIEQEQKNGKIARVLDGEHVQRSRLRVDTRKWVLARMLPKIYGDKIALTGDDGGAVRVQMVD